MKVLSIRQPWAWLILNAGKDIENRDWPTDLRGTIWIHAAGSMTKDEYRAAAITAGRIVPGVNIPAMVSLPKGGICGRVTITDCVTSSPSPWFFGKFGFVLEDPVTRVPFHPSVGRLGFFDLAPADAEILEEGGAR